VKLENGMNALRLKGDRKKTGMEREKGE